MASKHSLKKILVITSIILCIGVCIFPHNNRVKRNLEEQSNTEDDIRLTLVISHCNEDMAWMEEFLGDTKIKNVFIYSKCNHVYDGYTPPGSEIILQPNYGRCDHSYSHWMARMKEEDAADNHLVLFLKGSRTNANHPGMTYRTLKEMIRATKENGFACGYENSGVPYPHTPVTEGMLTWSRPVYRGSDIKSQYENMGEWIDAMGFELPKPTMPVCYGGNFMSKASQIYSKKNVLMKMEISLQRGDNIEEGHFAERTWAGLLSNN